MKYLRYLSYVLRHKWYVMIECMKYGLILEAIVHDISKFYPSEFLPYANHFYGSASNISKGRDETGYYKPTDTGDAEFDFAWLLHQKRNKHHWQWWCVPEEYGGLKAYDMPLKYLKEMVADWRGAGKAQNKPDTLKWYLSNKEKMTLSPDSRLWIEDELIG